MQKISKSYKNLLILEWIQFVDVQTLGFLLSVQCSRAEKHKKTQI